MTGSNEDIRAFFPFENDHNLKMIEFKDLQKYRRTIDIFNIKINLPLVREEHNLDYDTSFGGVLKVGVDEMIDHTDRIQMVFDLQNTKNYNSEYNRYAFTK